MGNLCFNLAAYRQPHRRESEELFYQHHAPAKHFHRAVSIAAGIGVWAVVLAALLH